VTAVDFGSAVQTNNITQTFAIENTGTADLAISNISVSGTDYSVASVITTIAAGTTETFTVTLSGASIGTFTSTVTIDNDDANENPFTFDITGVITATPEPEINVYNGLDNTGTAITDAQAGAIDFGSGIQGTDIVQTFAIENIGTSALTISGISATGTDFTVTNAIATVAVGTTQTFTVTLSGASTGTFNTTITIANDDANENPFTFDITGVIDAALVPEINVFEGVDNTGTIITNAQAGVIDFANATQGSDITQTFAIENIGTSALTISGITATGTDYTVTSAIATVAVGTTQTFTVTLSGASTGTFNTTITIANDDANENPFTFDITGVIDAPLAPEINIFEGVDNSGTVILDAQAGVIDFGNATQSTDITQTFAIENTGTSTLTISSITASGSDFSVSSTISTVTAGTTTTFTITLSGATTGTFNSTISITSDDANVNPFTFDITGVIDAPLIPDIQVEKDATIVNTFYDLGVIQSDEEIFSSFDIFNRGTGDLVVSSIISSSADFTVNTPTLPATILPAQSISIAIAFSSSVPVISESTITINSNDPDNPSYVFDVKATVEGAVALVLVTNPDNSVDKIVISNEDIDMGQTTLNKPIENVFGIENLSNGEAITVNSITVDNPAFKVVDMPTTIPANGFEPFTIVLIADNIGFYTGIVSVSTSINDFSFTVFGEVLAGTLTELVIYNVVTPNGDNIHDFLKIDNINQYPENRVIIYNRWGKMIFEKGGYDNQNNVFRGISNVSGDQKLITGNYYYTIDKGDGSELITGYLFLQL